MRILLTAETYPPRSGGVSVVVGLLASFLFSQGHAVTVATGYANRAKTPDEGIEVLEFGIAGNWIKGLTERTPGEVKRYREMLVDGAFDVVFQYAAQNWHVDAALQVLHNVRAAKILAPVGFSGLVGFRRRILYLRYFEIVLPRYLREYDALAFHSADYVDYRYAAKHFSGQMAILPLPVALDRIPRHGLPSDVSVDTHVYNVLCVSNHQRVKDHRFAVASVERLRKLGYDAHLTIVGNGGAGGRDCYAECRQLAERRPWLHLVEGVDFSGVGAYYGKADALLISSELEYTPVVMVEAMKAGVPVVSRRVGCVESMGKAALADTPKMAADMLAKVLTNRDFAALMVRENEKLSANFDASLVLPQYDVFFREVASRKAKSSRS